MRIQIISSTLIPLCSPAPGQRSEERKVFGGAIPWILGLRPAGQNRWATGFGGGDVVYPDRANEDRKLLAYTSVPLDSDLEITGSPVLTVQMSSTTSDGAIHAYLEDVAPEGRVTYLD
ncbi:MAG TPA: CocE/NonD family hydrolase C-terminal non-catalytic domain-containing protein, partial [Candidatus Acidoferrum sp.]|nr:CocE/NonD family hydrolase C-terminal non-catalytic domain-containing protein [Candidatus Acidoferrum sp.]